MMMPNYDMRAAFFCEIFNCRAFSTDNQTDYVLRNFEFIHRRKDDLLSVSLCVAGLVAKFYV
uniref:Uncharacterized protein n=1 Tax=Romanomermis culicivorax TaxID=13658 RepID=A0A915K495_ROMCU